MDNNLVTPPKTNIIGPLLITLGLCLVVGTAVIFSLPKQPQYIVSNTPVEMIGKTAPTILPTPIQEKTHDCMIPDYTAEGYVNPLPTEDGFCIANVNFGAISLYHLQYPKEWNGDIVGAARTNLRFNTGTPEEIFIAVTDALLPLEYAYKETHGYEGNRNPVIDLEERILTTTLSKVGEHPVLIVETLRRVDEPNFGEVISKVYYMVHHNVEAEGFKALFVFESNDSDEARANIENLISSLSVTMNEHAED